MTDFAWKKMVNGFDNRRDLVIPGDYDQTLDFCTHQFIQLAQNAIASQGFFTVALSGGSTPSALFKRLALPQNKDQVQWQKVRLFWSDERSALPTDPASNFHMAMASGFSSLPLNPDNIFRMHAEEDIEQHALHYESLIKTYVPNQSFDLILLGMGEDGHTASLFPKTHALHTQGRLVVANFVPQINAWRMTFTYECINAAKVIAIYVLGKNKAEILIKVLTSSYDPDNFPIQKVGTPEHKALWIADTAAMPEYPF